MLSTVAVGFRKLISGSEKKKASIEKEHQGVGTVSRSTYIAYLKSFDSSWLGGIFYFMLQVVMIACDVVTRLSLGWWADSMVVGQDGKVYILQYGASLALSACSTLGASFSMAIMIVNSSV